MKLLHTVATLDPAFGGPVEAIKQICLSVSDFGHESDVVCLDQPSSVWLNEFPAKVYALGPSWFKYCYSHRYVSWLEQQLHSYDAIIINGLWQYNSFGTWLAVKSLQKKGRLIPYFVYVHGMLDPWFKHTYPLKHLKKWLYWPWADYQVIRDASAVLFTCEEEKILARQSFSLYRAKETVVNLGTSLPSGEPYTQQQLFLTRFPQLKDKRIILFLSRIHPKKGCDLLIQAFAQLALSDSSVHLVMAGPDQIGWQADLIALAIRLGINHKITWVGMLSGDYKWGAYHAAEAFILPSHQENFGIVVAEAMACGLPVLISDKVNIWREIQADKAGFVVNDDVNGVSQLLTKWFSLSTEEKKEMRINAKRCFGSRFEIQSAAQNLIRVLVGSAASV